MNVMVRRGGPGDEDAVAELYLRARKAAAASGSIPAPVHTDDEVTDWIARIVIPRLELWIAESFEGKISGILVLDGEWIDQLYVDPDLTGHGIGGKLLDLAKRERPEGLRLWTFASNAGAQRFYERHGFVAVKYTDGSENEEGAPDMQYALRPSRPSTTGDRARVRASSAHKVPKRAPLQLVVGERVTVGERDHQWPEFVFVTSTQGEGWVPARHLSASSGEAVVQHAYDTTELPTQVGDLLEVVEEDLVGGWLRCRDGSGREGWVPVSTVRPHDE
jgi:GNAT superfamily N-acetyltransferase